MDLTINVFKKKNFLPLTRFHLDLSNPCIQDEFGAAVEKDGDNKESFVNEFGYLPKGHLDADGSILNSQATTPRTRHGCLPGKETNLAISSQFFRINGVTSPLNLHKVLKDNGIVDVLKADAFPKYSEQIDNRKKLKMLNFYAARPPMLSIECLGSTTKSFAHPLKQLELAAKLTRKSFKHSELTPYFYLRLALATVLYCFVILHEKVTRLYRRKESYQNFGVYFVLQILLSVSFLVAMLSSQRQRSSLASEVDPMLQYMSTCLIDKVEGFEVSKDEIKLGVGSTWPAIIIEFVLIGALAYAMYIFQYAMR